MTHKANCLNCGVEFESARARGTVFACSTACRKEFNNRRAIRGAEFYDLFMTIRYDRETATKRATWSKLCALAAHCRAEDERARAGRRSWQDERAVTERRPSVFSATKVGPKPSSKTKGEQVASTTTKVTAKSV